MTLCLLPLMASCFAHRAYDPRRQATPTPHQGEVKVWTVRGEVFMLRMVAVNGDTMTGERIFCASNWGYPENWCEGVKRFPADSARIAIPLADIERAQTRSFSAVRTVPVAVGVAAALALVILLAIGLSQMPVAY